MIKTMLIVSILIVSVSIGFSINNYLYIRKLIYCDFKNIIQSIKSEMIFLKTDKMSLLKNQECNTAQVKDFIMSYVSKGTGNIVCFKKDENDILIKFFNSIGRSDIDGELNNLQYYENILLNKLKNAEEKYSKYGIFTIKMSILLGVLLAIIFM